MEGGYILDAELLKDVSDAKRGPGLYTWLRQLDRAQENGDKLSKETQETLRSQLLEVILGSGSPPIRTLASKVLVRLFSGGETIRLFETINSLNDVLSKNKDDLPTRRLGAISCLGIMYSDLGRLTGRSYEETTSLLVKGLKSGESVTRVETMNALGKISASLGSAASPVHRDIYKSCRLALTDRAMSAKAASALCLLSLSEHAAFLHTSELENAATLCFRAMDGANYEARKAIAKLLGSLIAKTLSESPSGKKGAIKKGPHLPGEATTLLTVEEAFNILGNGFIKGGSSSGLIKGGSPVSQDVRVGVAHSYVVTVTTLGGAWLEKHHCAFLTHILELVSHPKACSTHVDAVYSRRCAGFIIRSLLGKLLGEKSQLKACEDLISMVAKMMKSIDLGPVNGNGGKENSGSGGGPPASSPVYDSSHSQHALYVALTELGFLLIRLGTSARSLVQSDSLLTPVLMNVLVHPSQAPRLAASWCLRCLCIAVPSILTPTIDKCLEGLEALKASPEAISGYSSALASLLGAVRHTPLGIPHTRGKVLFNVGEELLRTASQNSRLSRERTQAGWHLIGAIMTLGSSVVKGLLPRMMLLWRNAFPRSLKELESEKARGDSFTWKISLEARSGALATIHSFLQNCPELLNEDIRRRICVPVESALTLLSNMTSVLKSYQSELKALSAMLRLRLFETLSLLPPNCLESSFTPLLRLLVAEFTLTDGQSNASTSLLPNLCHSENSILLGTRFQDTEDISIEDQLLFPNSASGSVALEHDICSLYRKRKDASIDPCSLPLGVTVVDMAITVYGVVFPRVAQKHRVQMLNHFVEQLKQTTKTNARTEAIHLNIFCAILSGLKGLVDAKVGFGNQEDVKSALSKLILGSLTSQNPLMRCVSAEALGRMAQVISDSKFVAEMAQNSFDCLKSARDVVSRTGHSLALGCLHHYVGGMGSSQHLHTSVSILLALAQDSASPQVQVWSLHALALIADSGGPMFRSFVEPTLSTILKLLITVQSSQLEVMVCLGRVLSALITTVGPELQGSSNSITTARSSFLVACTILQNHGHPIVEAEAISSLQQLHMFAPSHVDLATLVPNLCRLLCSHHFVLRASAVSCLRQFAQKEAKEVCDHALSLIQRGNEPATTSEFVQFKESGLPGVFFSLLDLEVNSNMISNIHDTLNSIMQTMAAENLTNWLSLLREVLTVSSECDSQVLEDDKEEDADDAEFTTGGESNKEIVQPRWPTRVFAAICLRKIISECCQGDRAHYDLGLAKEMQLSQFNGGNDYLVLHLSELVRVAFMAATSESDPLRLEGLKTLEVVIEKFGDTQEPEFPGHVILEQYQAQVGAALRPAFSPDTASHVTSAACDVCSCWIGSGVARDLNDLRRVYQLLVGSLDKLKKGSGSQIYNESALTLEKLSILKAWAEVYIVSMREDKGSDDDFEDFESSKNDSLASLVQSELPSLSKYWIAALRDYALLSLPPEFKSQLPYDGGAFYTNDTIESARPHYRSTWPQMLQASAIWLTVGHGFSSSIAEESNEDENNNINRFHLIFGVCIEALSNSRCSDLTQVQVTSCLIGLKALLDDPWCRENPFLDSPELGVELCNVLHRTVLTRDRPSIQALVLDVLVSLLQMRKLNNSKDDAKLCEGGTDGRIEPGTSVVFASLEVCLCILIRHYPDLSPRAANLNSFTAIQAKSFSIVIKQQPELITRAISALSLVPGLCSTPGALTVLPSVLYLLTGVLIKESKALLEDAFRESDEQSPPIRSSITAIKDILALDLTLEKAEEMKRWEELLVSSFAQILKEYDSLDEDTLLLTLTLLILKAPVSVCLSLRKQTLEPFKKCLEDNKEIQVKLRCMQTLSSVFGHSEPRISHFYIVSLSPRLFQIIFVPHPQLKNEKDLRFLLEIINLLETLILKGGSPDSILQFLIPALVNQCLCGQDLFKCYNRLSLGLHDKALNKLTALGQKYPVEFKGILGSQAPLKSRLENALKDNQVRLAAAAAAAKSSPSPASSPVKSGSSSSSSSNHHPLAGSESQNSSSATPSIKLTTDFSNFVVK